MSQFKNYYERKQKVNHNNQLFTFYVKKDKQVLSPHYQPMLIPERPVSTQLMHSSQHQKVYTLKNTIKMLNSHSMVLAQSYSIYTSTKHQESKYKQYNDNLEKLASKLHIILDNGKLSQQSELIMRNRTKSQIIGDKAKTMGNAMQKHNQSHSRNLVEKELVGKHYLQLKSYELRKDGRLGKPTDNRNTQQRQPQPKLHYDTPTIFNKKSNSFSQQGKLNLQTLQYLQDSILCEYFKKVTKPSRSTIIVQQNINGISSASNRYDKANMNNNAKKPYYTKRNLAQVFEALIDEPLFSDKHNPSYKTHPTTLIADLPIKHPRSRPSPIRKPSNTSSPSPALSLFPSASPSPSPILLISPTLATTSPSFQPLTYSSYTLHPHRSTITYLLFHDQQLLTCSLDYTAKTTQFPWITSQYFSQSHCYPSNQIYSARGGIQCMCISNSHSHPIIYFGSRDNYIRSTDDFTYRLPSTPQQLFINPYQPNKLTLSLSSHILLMDLYQPNNPQNIVLQSATLMPKNNGSLYVGDQLGRLMYIDWRCNKPLIVRYYHKIPETGGIKWMSNTGKQYWAIVCKDNLTVMDQRGVVNTLTMNKECKVVDYHWTSRDKLMLLAKDDTKNLCQILRTDCSSELVTLDEVSPTATLIRMYNDKLFTCYTNGSLLIHPNLTI